MRRKERIFAAGRLLLAATVLAVFTACGRERAATQPPSLPTQPPPAVSSPPAEQPSTTWKLTSPAFQAGERMPVKYTGDGQDVSPPLSWTEPPAETQELALICDDPDAPRGIFNHWLVYDLSPGLSGLPENVLKQTEVATPACRQGLNSAGKPGYMGPAPPPGPPHRYQFTLYALKEKSGLPPGANREEVLKAIEGKVLAKTSLEVLYGR